MSNEQEKKIFARNLMNLIRDHGKNQNEVAKDLGYAQTTFNNWCIGKVMPRSAADIQAIADYFHVGKSFLVENNHSAGYVVDPETFRLAQDIKKDPDLMVLLDASRSLNPDEIRALSVFIKAHTSGRN